MKCFTLQGIRTASTGTPSRGCHPNETVSPYEEEAADFGRPDTGDIALLENAYKWRGSPSTSPLQGEWEAELKRLETLRQGWNGYDAPTPTSAAIETARRYLQVVKREGFEPKRVEPSVMGGVGITHRQGNRKVYLELYNNGTGHSLFSDRSGKMHTIPVTPSAEDFRRFVAKAKDYLNGKDPS